MVTILLLLQLLSRAEYATTGPTGHIQGVVVDASHNNANLANVTVTLLAGPEGALIPVEKVTTDIYGKFAFPNVPADPSITYQPGAERDGVHYPGTRLSLTADDPIAHQIIRTYEGVSSPTPLVAEEHQIVVHVDSQALNVQETLVVNNSSLTTYVGQKAADESVTTLRLSIPPVFERVTFQNEFYGRRFRVVDHQPVTDIPWPPGERVIKFTYRIPLESNAATLRRILDLPSRNIDITVRGRKSSEVICTLPTSHQGRGEIAFASGGKELPVGYAIELQVGARPMPWLQYARYGSLITLLVLAAATVLIIRRESPGPPTR